MSEPQTPVYTAEQEEQNKLKRAYLDGYYKGCQDTQKAAPRWVRCEERLPKDTEQVLCANPSVIIKGDYFYETCVYRDKTVSRSGFYRYDSEFGFVMEHPVYWMPIEPPKEE